MNAIVKGFPHIYSLWNKAWRIAMCVGSISIWVDFNANRDVNHLYASHHWECVSLVDPFEREKPWDARWVCVKLDTFPASARYRRMYSMRLWLDWWTLNRPPCSEGISICLQKLNVTTETGLIELIQRNHLTKSQYRCWKDPWPWLHFVFFFFNVRCRPLTASISFIARAFPSGLMWFVASGCSGFYDSYVQ